MTATTNAVLERKLARVGLITTEGFRDETQVIATILGSDQSNPHDIISINGASAALMISGIPFDGPIGAVRLSRQGSEWIAHPTFQEGDESTFEIVVAGRQLDDLAQAGGAWRSSIEMPSGSRT